MASTASDPLFSLDALLADLQTSIPAGGGHQHSSLSPTPQSYTQHDGSHHTTPHQHQDLQSNQYRAQQQQERVPQLPQGEPRYSNGEVGSSNGFPPPPSEVYYQESKEEVRTETRSSGPQPSPGRPANELDSLLSELNSTRYSAGKERVVSGGAAPRPSVDSLLNELNSVSSQPAARTPVSSSHPPPITASTATRDLDDLMAELSGFKVREVPILPASPAPPSSKVLHNTTFKSTTTTTTSTSTNKDASNNLVNVTSGPKNVPTAIIDVHNASVKPTQNDKLRSPALVRRLLNRHDTYAKPEKPKSPSPVLPPPPPPVKEPSPPPANELDCMLGSLANHMTEQGVNTTQKGCCTACDKPIVGQVITALGKTWHPEHFTCAHCNQELGSKNFFERDGRPYCEACYHELFSPRCAYCNGSILDKCVTALDKNWHPDHFFCAQCGNTFGEEGFHEKDGKAYCREDYYNMFAPKCGGCNSPIMENYISALNAQWHPECFVCRDCKKPVSGKSYYAMENKPVCAGCVGVSDDEDGDEEEDDD